MSCLNTFGKRLHISAVNIDLMCIAAQQHIRAFPILELLIIYGYFGKSNVICLTYYNDKKRTSLYRQCPDIYFSSLDEI